MPIIRPQHKNDPWRPLQAWPDDCIVQWGRNGVVFGQKDAYTTGFFEAFPQDGVAGFLRGEGETLEQAEESAFEAYSRQRRCFEAGGHQWTRARRLRGFEARERNGRKVPKVSTYTNGGAFCVRCHAFQSGVMPEVPELGAWRQPLSYGEMETLMMGLVRPDPGMDAMEDERGRRKSGVWRRRLELRARMFGIDLPDHRLPEYQRPEGLNPFAEDDYMKACREAVVRHYVRLRDKPEKEGGGITGMFEAMAIRRLEAEAQEMGQAGLAS